MQYLLHLKNKTESLINVQPQKKCISFTNSAVIEQIEELNTSM